MTRTRRWGVGLTLWIALTLVGCPKVNELDDGGPDADTPAMDAGRDSGTDGGTDGGTDDAGDDAGSDAGGSDAGPTTRPLGAPCTRDGECTSGICFPVAAGRSVCTSTCPSAESCPAGWTCDSFGGDMVCQCASEAERCNGLDDDCDGAVDEGRAEAIGCGEGEACTAGACGCPAERMCGARCIDIDTDPNHCGACGDACASDALCRAGACCTPSAETCNGVDDDCDGAVDEGSPSALGCEPLEACLDGACSCPSRCGELCVDLESDTNHCGRCGNACEVGLDCVGGTCCEAAGTRVDVLFVVDNSNSMQEEQASFAAALPEMVRVLATGDIDGDGTPESDPVRDLHVGVVTTDMGAAGHLIPTCDDANFGDDGVLQTEATAPGCDATYPSFLTFQPGTGDPGAFAADAACVTVVGTSGCGFEQPLEAGLKAVTPSTSSLRFAMSTPGHADGTNAGFLRDDSVLVTFFLTDENDCSASDPQLFATTGPYAATDLNLRCSAHPEALHPLTRYVDGLLATRDDPRDLIFTAVTGIPVDLVSSPPNYTAILTDERMDEVPTPEANRLRAVCDVPGRGLAFPSRRVVRTAQELSERGATSILGSICQSSYEDTMARVLDRIVARLGESCAM